MMAMAAPGVKIDANPLRRSDTWKLSLARLVFADSMTRMALLPPKAPAESISILRKASNALSRDQDFLQDAITAMRFQPRFEVGEAGERLFQPASQTNPEVISFLRDYIEQANRVSGQVRARAARCSRTAIRVCRRALCRHTLGYLYTGHLSVVYLYRLCRSYRLYLFYLCLLSARGSHRQVTGSCVRSHKQTRPGWRL
jgi:hypothetical protein